MIVAFFEKRDKKPWPEYVGEYTFNNIEEAHTFAEEKGWRLAEASTLRDSNHLTNSEDLL